MVPRMVSTILSYEDERRSVIDRYGEDHGYSYFDKKAEVDMEESDDLDAGFKTLPSNRLIIKPAAEGGSVLLLYPSRALVSLVEWSPAGDADVKGIVERVRSELKVKLSVVLGDGFAGANGGSRTLRWYLKAVLELEKEMGFEPEDFFASIEEGDGDAYRSPELELIETWRRMSELPIDELGGVPENLCDVLAEMAVASPAVCVFRTFELCRHIDKGNGLDPRDAGTGVCLSLCARVSQKARHSFGDAGRGIGMPP